MKAAWFILLLLSASPAGAGLVATRDLPAGTLITQADVAMDMTVAAGMSEPAQAIGMQARIAIYEGRPVIPSALRPPVVVQRNKIVRLIYKMGALRIESEGRALDDGAVGDSVRVMNMSSRNTVTALVEEDGTLSVGPEGY